MLTIGVWTIALILLIAHWEKIRAFIKVIADNFATFFGGLALLAILLVLGSIPIFGLKWVFSRVSEESARAGPQATIGGIAGAIFMVIVGLKLMSRRGSESAPLIPVDKKDVASPEK